MEATRVRWSPGEHHARYLGYDIAGAPHDDDVADAHVLALDLILVVQRSVGNGHTAHVHRFEPRHRCELAGAPHLHVDADEARHLLLRREFVGKGPAWRAGHEAHLTLLV